MPCPLFKLVANAEEQGEGSGCLKVAAQEAHGNGGSVQDAHVEVAYDQLLQTLEKIGDGMPYGRRNAEPPGHEGSKDVVPHDFQHGCQRSLDPGNREIFCSELGILSRFHYLVAGYGYDLQSLKP